MYKNGLTIKDIERSGACSFSKARKILIHAGLYQSKRSLEINQYINDGLSLKEIADKLNITLQTINSHLKYNKGIYLDENPTKNAISIRKYRSKIQNEKTIK